MRSRYGERYSGQGSTLEIRRKEGISVKVRFRCSIWMGNYGIDVYSNSAAVISMLSRGNFVHIIPEYNCNLERSHSGYSLYLYLEKDLPFSIGVSGDRKIFEIRGKSKELLQGSTVPYVIHYLLEPQRLEAGQFTIRGAGVSKDGQGLLLLGKSGAGKTSVALEMCRGRGYSLVGNNVVLAGMKDDQAYLYGGEKIFRFRLATLKHYNVDLKWAFGGVEPGADDWMITASVLPSEVGVPLEKNKVSVRMVIYLHLLNDKTASLHIAPVDTLFSRLYLYDIASQYIRGVCTPVLVGKTFEYGGYLPSLDKPEYYLQRKKLIDWIINSENYHYIVGPINKICDYVDSHLKP